MSDTTYWAMELVAYLCLGTMIAIWIVEIVRIWRDRPPVVWDYDQQRWRSARLVMEDREHGPAPRR